MGLFGSIIEKYAEIAAQRKHACDEADMFILKTESYINAQQGKFIDMEWVPQIRNQCCEHINQLSRLGKKTILSRAKLTSVRNKLEVLNSGIDNTVQLHNEAVARAMIADGRRIIGNVEGRQLDDQQMICIVKPSHNHLVIAGAGTGKTTTIVGKVKYLLNSGQYAPEDILVLSYTNASATEMSMRINKEANCSISASTFHKLGLNIINKVEGKKPKITKVNLIEFTKDKLSELMKENRYIELLCNYLFSQYKFSKTEHDFISRTEYDDYLRLNPPITLNGEKVKSYGEMDIANFLFRNGVKYVYEKEYEVDTRTTEYAQYYPDFYLPEYGIYIEYFGINRNGMVPAFFSPSGDAKSASKVYQDGMAWKRDIHRKNNTILIECYAYEKEDGTLLDNLVDKLQKIGVKFTPLSAEQVWQSVTENNSQDLLSTIGEFFATVITLIKSNKYDFDFFKSKCLFSLGAIRNETVISLIEPIYRAYEKLLRKNGEIDFNDMINNATELVRKGAYVNPYKIVIVDEYQDISKARFNLLCALRDSADYDLFCVGDDWQSIYRFTGSDMGYILHFQDYWGSTVKSKIETTYRFAKSLIDISGKFVMRNPAQIAKSIQGKTEDLGFALGEIKGLNEQIALSFMLQRIDELPKNSSVFFIGRYKFDAKLLDGCCDLKCNYDNEHGIVDVVYLKRTDLKMTFITAHRSKGLQADYVFIINNKQKGLGFPSMIQDDPIIDALLESKESFPYAEERRLFYVALTRAKRKAFMLVVEGNESDFAKELEQRYEKELVQERFTCPLCGGNLSRKNGEYGEFYGCSNYQINGCKFVRKIGNILPGNIMQSTMKCPKCGNNLLIRTVKTGTNAGHQFYGCSGYPNCKYTRNMV